MKFQYTQVGSNSCFKDVVRLANEEDQINVKQYHFILAK
jgi:hypothetical protein